MDFLLGIFLYMIGFVSGIAFGVFAPSKIKKKIEDLLKPDEKKTTSSYSQPVLNSESGSGSGSGSGSESSYFDRGSGSTFLRGSSSNR